VDTEQVIPSQPPPDTEDPAQRAQWLTEQIRQRLREAMNSSAGNQALRHWLSWDNQQPR
jgi:hypothetical protein